MGRVVRSSVLLLSLAAAPAAWSASESVTPWVNVGTIYSDNAGHTHLDPAEVTTLDTTAGVRVRHDGPNIDVRGDAQLLYRHFLSGDFDDDTLPSANALASWQIVPDRFSLSAEESLGQISNRVFDALTSTDRQNVNYASIGPDLVMPFGTRERLEMEARYGRSTFSGSDIDSNRYTGDIAFRHFVSEFLSFSLNDRYEEVHYTENDSYPKSTTNRAFFRLSAESFRTLVLVDAGAGTTDPGGTGARQNYPYFNFVFQRLLSPRLTLNTEYIHSAADAAELLRADVRNGFAVGGDQPVQAVPESFKLDRVSVVLIRTGVRSSAAVQAYGTRENYKLNPQFDRKERGADFMIDWRLTSAWTVAGKVRWYHENIALNDIDRSQYEAQVGLSRRVSRSLRMSLMGEISSGGGDQDLDRYHAKSIGLFVQWSPREVIESLFDPVSEFRGYSRQRTPAGVDPATGLPAQPPAP
jgi:hypothetical protein